MTARPNPLLMELYGTDEYYLEKVGFLGAGMLLSGLRAGAGIGSIYAARAQAKHHEQLAAEAAQLNQHFRLIEAQKMSAVVESLGGPRNSAVPFERMGKTSSLDPRLEKIAMNLGRSLAYQEMDKEAIPSMSSMWQGMKGMAGKVFGGAKGLAKTEAGAAGAAGSAGAAVRPGFKPPGVQFHPGTPGAAGMTGAPVPGPRPAPLASATAAPATAAATPNAAATPAKNKPWISTGTKIKAGLGLAGVGAIGTAGLVGYKGLQEAGDYMRTPTQTNRTWGGHGYSPMHNVNPYGYVQPQY